MIFIFSEAFTIESNFQKNKVALNNSTQNYTFIERTDLRQYNNGKYLGLLSREVKAFINPVTVDNGLLYDGIFYINQDTRRGISYVSSGIHDGISSVFLIDNANNFSMIEDYGFPSFRNFPVCNYMEMKIGDSWEGTSERAVDPLNKGIFTRFPIFVRYTYLGDETFNGEEVYLLSAKWATRYGEGTKYFDENGDYSLKSATGTHNATIYISKIKGNALVIRDSVDETFVYSDGNKIQHKGTISLFTEYPPSVKAEDVLPKLKDIKDINFEETDAGLKLTISNLQFKANSAELLLGEENRLDSIAQALKTAPESLFLVEGHTADTGNPKGEMELSIERARSIINELIKRGVNANQFISKGAGGTKPLADNSILIIF